MKFKAVLLQETHLKLDITPFKKHTVFKQTVNFEGVTEVIANKWIFYSIKAVNQSCKKSNVCKHEGFFSEGSVSLMRSFATNIVKEVTS